jgi:hypothetical protein
MQDLRQELEQLVRELELRNEWGVNPHYQNGAGYVLERLKRLLGSTRRQAGPNRLACLSILREPLNTVVVLELYRRRARKVYRIARAISQHEADARFDVLGWTVRKVVQEWRQERRRLDAGSALPLASRALPVDQTFASDERNIRRVSRT